MMYKLHLVACLALFLVLQPVNICGQSDQQTRIADEIRSNIESSLYSFSPELQEHYAARMYRITGDDRYVHPIMFNMIIMIRQLESDTDSLQVPEYADRRTKQLLDKFEGGSRKSRIRRQLFEDSGNMLFYLDCLHRCAMLTDYRIPDDKVRSDIQKSIAVLKEIDFREFLLDKEVIMYFAAQAVNYVYDLYYLGIVDIRDLYRGAFREVFPDRDDDYLKKLEYKDKIYGLTHFIFAASRYYQQIVSAEEFGWILDYFSANIDRILEETKEDIIAEVGLCYLLANKEDAPEVNICRQAIAEAFDEGKGMIPSVSGDDNLLKGEHRNVLAIMLLKWPGELHAGPHFDESEIYEDIFPGSGPP